VARKTGANTPSVKVPLELNVSREEAKAKLQDRIEKGLALKTQISSQSEYELLSNEYDKWDSFNSELLKRIFTSEELEEEYSYSSLSISMSRYEKSIGEKIADRFKNIDTRIHRLDSIIERLELIPLNSALTIATSSFATESLMHKSKKVFVVHGHDEKSKTNLEVFLHEIGLEPVVLHRQADEGLTIIEKFEKHGDVGYAFILLTPDEIAYLSSEENKPDGERLKEYRARPNVIFEFGYFIGRLGRSKVCCLHTGSVKLPSDVSGVIYKSYQTSIEEVAYSIIKDLKAAGYTVA
jgi:predicted nucleotide-binding protein